MQFYAVVANNLHLVAEFKISVKILQRPASNTLSTHMISEPLLTAYYKFHII